jgi:hypothetical protein
VTTIVLAGRDTQSLDLPTQLVFFMTVLALGLPLYQGCGWE